MRISSSMIYETGIRAIGDQTSKLMHTQQMLSTNRRMVTPSDDPVAAARALVVTEAKDINNQFATNQSNAKNALSLEEAQMSSLGDVLTRIRELAVQGGDAALSPNDLKSIATELRSRFDELLGLSNTTDSNGDFIFAGNMGDTKPFGANIDGLLAAPGNEVTYSGDSGQRNLQVSATRLLGISDAGNNIFRDIRNGNGSFVTDYFRAGSPGVPNTPNTVNTGTGIIGAGSVTNPAAWAAVPDKNIKIQFYVDSTVSPNTTYYDLVNSTGTSLLTGAPAVAPVFPGVPAGLRTFQPNQTIDFSGLQPGGNTSYGANVIVDGNPANGDSFTIAPSTTQSVFKTIANLVGVLEGQNFSTLTGTAYVPNAATDAGGTLNLTINGLTRTITIPSVLPGSYTSNTLANAMNGAITAAFGSNIATVSGANGNIVITAKSSGSAGISVAAGSLAVTNVFTTATPTANFTARSGIDLANQIGQALTNIDQATDNVLRVRSNIGARLNELDSLSSVNQDVDLRYQETLSGLQDVDFARAISDLQQHQTNLDAAQKSYMKVTQLGLFNYL